MAHVVEQLRLPHGRTLELVHGDLTEQAVDAIVNAANQQLQHGGGVAAAIVSKGGGSIQQESNDWVQQHGPISHDRPAVTTAGDLPAQHIIHAVGPRWGEGDEDHRLHQAVYSALAKADALGLQSVALPPISTGVFGFPKPRAAGVILDAVHAFDEEFPESSVVEVRLAIIDEATLEPFQAAFQGRKGGEPSGG